MSDPLFPAYATHITVECWNCSRVTKLYPNGAFAGMALAEFQSRAKCQGCGAGLPRVVAHPRAPSRWAPKGPE